MPELEKLFAELSGVCADPRAQLDAALAAGRKAVGVMPYFCPEELVYAAGMLPFGLWGAEMTASESKRYFPAFVCSILHTTLELGLRGDLDGLSAVMAPACCDALKGMDGNWRYGVGARIPFLHVAYAQNRATPAGVTFTAAQFRKLLRRLEEIAGRAVTDADVDAAIRTYDENRAALRAFTAAAAAHPELVSPAQRSAVIKSGFFLDRRVHTEKVRAVTAALEAAPAVPWDGVRVVTTGILADAPALLRILADNRVAVADDQVAQESVLFRADTPAGADPVERLAARLGVTEGCSVLFDPEKRRGTQLVSLAQAARADGILWVMTKFCDPEEFDFVPVKRMADAAGIPLLAVDVDQQMGNYEQARSAVEAFAELLRARR